MEYDGKDLSYLAGLIDAQGASVHVYIGTSRKKESKSFKAYLHVQSSQESLLKWIAYSFGGSIINISRNSTDARLKFDSNQKKIRMTKVQYKWIPVAVTMIPLCHQLLPYIKARKEELMCLIEARMQVESEDKIDWSAREALVEKLKKIKLDKRSY